MLSDPKIAEIARKRGKTAAQILLRWNYQLGNVVLFRTTKSKRLEENRDIFGFRLSDEEMDALGSLDCGYRLCKVEW